MMTKPFPQNPTTTPTMSHSPGPDWLASSAPTKSCIFHKLMVAPILQHKKLSVGTCYGFCPVKTIQKISTKFVKIYGEELSSLATVSVPNGRFWVVELQKIDDKMWFDNGWHEFVEFYSIRVGHFLIFRYDGKSHFNIFIFDLTVSEVKYPLSGSTNLQEMRPEYPATIKEQVKDDEIKEIDSSGSPCLTSESPRCKKLTDPGSCNHIEPAASLQTLPSNGSVVTGLTDKFVSGISSEREKKRRRRRRRQDEATSKELEHRSLRRETTNQTFTRRWRAVTIEEKRQALQLSDKFTSGNPFFKVVLRPSYVYRGFLLHVPSFFGRKYLNFTGLVTLEVCDGRRWSVRCSYSNGHAKLVKGWSEFAWGNNLEEGDVCVFELSNVKDNVLSVTIFRVLEDAPPPLTMVESGGPC